jgi:hypothetical protein
MSLMMGTMMSFGMNDSLYIDHYRHPVGLYRVIIISNKPYREPTVMSYRVFIESIVSTLFLCVKNFILSKTIDFYNVKH